MAYIGPGRGFQSISVLPSVLGYLAVCFSVFLVLWVVALCFGWLEAGRRRPRGT